MQTRDLFRTPLLVRVPQFFSYIFGKIKNHPGPVFLPKRLNTGLLKIQQTFFSCQSLNFLGLLRNDGMFFSVFFGKKAYMLAGLFLKDYQV